MPVPDAASGALPSAGLRLLAVHAHPDDESSKGAATMARYVREGADVLVVTCTGGERGSHPQPGDGPSRDPRRHPRTPVARWSARGRSSVCSTTGSGSSTPACRRAIRSRRCPTAASRSSRWRSRGAARPDRARLPAARHPDVRRAAAGTRTRTTSRPTRSASRRSNRGGIRSLPRHRRRAVAAVEALLPPDVPQAAARSVARRGLAAGIESPFSRVARRLGGQARGRGPRDHPASRAPTSSRFVTRRSIARHPGRPVRALVRPPAGESSKQAWPTEDYQLARSAVETRATRGRPVRRCARRGRPDRYRAVGVITYVGAPVATPSPVATTTSTATGTASPGYTGPADDSHGGAGSLGVLVVVGMILAAIVLFWAMNRSLRRAQRNLGGDSLPRRRPGQRPRPTIPQRDDPPTP